MRGPIQRTPPRRGSPEGARPGHQTTEAGAKRSDGRHRRQKSAIAVCRKLRGSIHNRESEFRPITLFCYRSKIYHGNKTGHFRAPVQKQKRRARLVDVSIYIIHTCLPAAPGLTLLKKHFDRQATIWAGSRSPRNENRVADIYNAVSVRSEARFIFRLTTLSSIHCTQIFKVHKLISNIKKTNIIQSQPCSLK